MRYEFYGRRMQYTGKSMWEILGNLKNFGVGRLIRRSRAVLFDGPSFLKINKVQPLPEPKNQFHNRKVIIWVDEYFNGKKICENKMWAQNYLPLYHLISKPEEEELYKKLEEYKEKVPKRQIYKYLYWPPLYKKLWEAAMAKDPKLPPLPNLKTIHRPYPKDEINYIDSVNKPKHCNLHRTEVSVEEKLKEIVHLKKLIIANTQPQDT